jgi:hypothetical protein
MKTLKSAKYPGWTIEKESDTEYFMTRDAGIYGVAVYGPDGDWTGELMTRQTWEGVTSWEPAHNPAEGSVPKVVAEAERRARYIEGLKEVKAA